MSPDDNVICFDDNTPLEILASISRQLSVVAQLEIFRSVSWDPSHLSGDDHLIYQLGILQLSAGKSFCLSAVSFHDWISPEKKHKINKTDLRSDIKFKIWRGRRYLPQV
jgi:hypothetical protein